MPAALQSIAETLRPTPIQIDEMVTHYEQLLDELELADERYEECKDAMIALVQRFGIVPAAAEHSVRLEGRVTTLTVTISSTNSTKEDAVGDLKVAMAANGKLSLFARMFNERTKYELQKDAANQLRIEPLSKRLYKLFDSLLARCTEVRKKSPSLKIERLDGAKRPKPAKKGGR